MFPSWVCFILTSRQFMLLSSSFWCFRPLLGPQLSKQQIHVLSLIQPALHLKPQSPGEASYQDKRSTKRTMQWEVQFTGNGQQYGQTRFFEWQKKQIQTMDWSLMIQVRKVLCCGLGPWDCDIFNSPANNRKLCNVFATRLTTDFLCAYAELWKAFFFTVAYTHQGPSKVLHVSGKKSTKSSSSASRSSGSGEESYVKTGNIKSKSCWTFLIESYIIVMTRSLSSCHVFSIAHWS